MKNIMLTTAAVAMMLGLTACNEADINLDLN